MNENYKWKGVSFNTKGIIIEKTPISNIPKHSFTQYTIPGRSGYLTIDNKTYEPILLSLECHLDTNNVDINDIRSWLDGYGELQIDNEKKYKGIISNSIKFDKITHFRKFIIQFTLQPLAKSLTSITLDGLTTTEFNSTTFADTYPKLTITGTGDITFKINNIGFTIYDADGTYILDCEAKIITKNGVNQSSVMSGEFPYIKNGSNSITKTGNISDVTIEYSNLYL